MQIVRDVVLALLLWLNATSYLANESWHEGIVREQTNTIARDLGIYRDLVSVIQTGEPLPSVRLEN